MDERDWLKERFEANRGYLGAVAHRMLGSAAEADDAVRQAWLRLDRADPSEVESLRAWLTTVVGRVSLKMLCSRSPEPDATSIDRHVSDLSVRSANALDPAQETLLGESACLALLIALDTLSPAERVAFVLHAVFAVPFDQIATIVDRSPTAARQLVSRARRRIRAAPLVGHTSTPDGV